LLCEALWSTALAGKPDEYFHSGTAEEYSNEWKTTDFSEYLAKVLEFGTTPNKVFGCKIMWTDFQDHYLSNTSSLDASVLKDLAPEFRYIWIRRLDRLRQAISIWKRKQTGIISWYSSEPPKYKTTPEFDFEALNRLVQLVGIWDRNWATYFESNGISPLVITYEDDLQDYGTVVKKILQYLQIPVPQDLHVEAKRKKLSDEMSEYFVRLYQSCE
jgi:LPS sulfotransferase NodH